MWCHSSGRLTLSKLKKLNVLLLRKCHWWRTSSRDSYSTQYLHANMCPIWPPKLFPAVIWSVVSATTMLTWNTTSAIYPSTTSASARTTTTTTCSSHSKMIWCRRVYTGGDTKNPSKRALKTKSRVRTKNLASNLRREVRSQAQKISYNCKLLTISTHRSNIRCPEVNQNGLVLNYLPLLV